MCTRDKDKVNNVLSIEWFSLECQKVIAFASPTLRLHKMFPWSWLYESRRWFGFQRHAFKYPQGTGLLQGFTVSLPEIIILKF